MTGPVTIVLIVAAYLCGCIPSGVLFARTAGVDVRRAGSGNVGATNVARTAGLRLGLATLLVDTMKGLVPVVVARWLAAGDTAAAAAGLAAVLGHLFPVTLGFAGGKGVATALGVSLALYPLATVPTVGAFAVTLAASGFVSLASLVASALAPLCVWALGYPTPFVSVAAATAVLIVARHGDNVGRLLSGTEPKLRLHKKQATPTK